MTKMIIENCFNRRCVANFHIFIVANRSYTVFITIAPSSYDWIYSYPPLDIGGRGWVISGSQSYLQKQSFKNTTQIEFCRNTLIGRRNLNLLFKSKKTGVQNFDNKNSVGIKRVAGYFV